jgi:hypothetical protein
VGVLPCCCIVQSVAPSRASAVKHVAIFFQLLLHYVMRKNLKTVCRGSMFVVTRTFLH